MSMHDYRESAVARDYRELHSVTLSGSNRVLDFEKYKVGRSKAISFGQFVDQSKDKKDNSSSTTSILQYPTGYSYLDYASGSYLTVHDEKTGAGLYQYHNIGVAGGQFITVIAKSQGGKSSLCLGLGSAVIEPYTNQFMYEQLVADMCREIGIEKIPRIENYPMIEVMDSEHSMSIDYARKVCRYNATAADRFIKITDVVTDRDLMKALKKHIEYKVKYLQKLPNPMLDTLGKPVYNYPPTIIIIDSLSQLLLEDMDEDKMDSKDKKNDMLSIYESAVQNTSGARRAKTLGTLISYLVDYAKRFNILIYSISHINKMLPVNGIPVKQARFLRAGEAISGGGERALYLASSILRLDVIKAIGVTKSTMLNLGDGIDGFVAQAQWIKCKTNSKVNPVQLAYTNLSGYDPLLSDLVFGKECGDLTPVGNKFCLRDYPDYKFTLKDYRDVFAEHPEMFTAYYDELRDKCSRFLDNPEAVEEHNRKLFDQARDDIHEIETRTRSDREDIMDLDDLLQVVNA